METVNTTDWSEIEIAELESIATPRDYNPTGNSRLWDNIEPDLAEVTNKAFETSLHVRSENSRETLYSLEDKITLRIDGNKVRPFLGNIMLQGAKRTLVFKYLINHSPEVKNWTTYGETSMSSEYETVFDTYQITWNKKEYNVGFIHNESFRGSVLKAYTHANYMTKRNPAREPKGEDVQVWSHQINGTRWSYEYDDPQELQAEIDSLEEQLERAKANLDAFIKGI